MGVKYRTLVVGGRPGATICAIAGEQNVDLLVCVQESGISCVQVFTIRSGNVLGNKNFFPANTEGMECDEVLDSFVGQYYQHRELPEELILSHKIDSLELIQAAFSEKKGRKVGITSQVRGERARWLGLAKRNAEQAIEMAKLDLYQ